MAVNVVLQVEHGLVDPLAVLDEGGLLSAVRRVESVLDGGREPIAEFPETCCNRLVIGLIYVRLSASGRALPCRAVAFITNRRSSMIARVVPLCVVFLLFAALTPAQDAKKELEALTRLDWTIVSLEQKPPLGRNHEENEAHDQRRQLVRQVGRRSRPRRRNDDHDRPVQKPQDDRLYVQKSRRQGLFGHLQVGR